jgi:AraC-like DNA-binding protein
MGTRIHEHPYPSKPMPDTFPRPPPAQIDQTSQPENEKLTHWLLASIALDTALLHVGQYCGPWQASTAGEAMASFHLVMHGNCFLHLPGAAPIALHAREGVFLLRDMPHFLSPYPDPAAIKDPMAMQPLGPASEGGTGLACGVFQFRGALSTLIVDSLPDYLISRANDPALSACASLFELILAETGGDPERPSPLIARLVELLFFYLIRHAAQGEAIAPGLLALTRRSEFSALLDQMLRAPAAPWHIDDMARATHMSRASFCKHFTAACNLPPAQFVLLLRMKIAAQRLSAGESVERAAAHVGYLSQAAFTRAFKRVIGDQPGTYRRRQRQSQNQSQNQIQA